MARVATNPLCGRDVALLRRWLISGEIEPGSLPVLYVDGRVFCDTAAAHRLVQAGLVAAPAPGAGKVPAVLTSAGRAELAIGRN